MRKEGLSDKMKWWVAGGILLPVAIYVGYSFLDKFDPNLVRGKTVIITGASAGIGEQLAYHYCRMGARVFITARTEKRLREVLEKCQRLSNSNVEHYYMVADMKDMAVTKHLIETAKAKMGRIDFLVLNHIVVCDMGPWMGTPENLTLVENIMDVNFLAYVNLASHALPHLEETNGSLVVLSSVAGRVPQPYIAAYAASKFAVDGFFGTLRQELMMRNVNVSVTLCILGFIGTNNAMNAMQRFGLDFLMLLVSPADPAETALAVLKAGAVRQRELYFPYFSARTLTLLRDICPNFIAALLRILYSQSVH